MRGKSLAKAAAQEAFEEAGVEGVVDTKPLGTFRHTKQHLGDGVLDVSIVVHPLAVERELAKWPEHAERERKWFSIKQAAQRVESDDLKQIIRDLKARVAKG
jgi:ADP-ribose pyrophosphatase YjhB (NUDIX family)